MYYTDFQIVGIGVLCLVVGFIIGRGWGIDSGYRKAFEEIRNSKEYFD